MFILENKRLMMLKKRDRAAMVAQTSLSVAHFVARLWLG